METIEQHIKRLMYGGKPPPDQQNRWSNVEIELLDLSNLSEIVLREVAEQVVGIPIITMEELEKRFDKENNNGAV